VISRLKSQIRQIKRNTYLLDFEQGESNRFSTVLTGPLSDKNSPERHVQMHDHGEEECLFQP
jgi:hypothetical protein